MNSKENYITDEELALIGQYTRKEMSREELYTFPVILCDNDIDRDGEKFTVSALNELAKLFIGKTGIFDHDMSSKDQTARIYTAGVETDSTRKTADGEVYTYLRAKAYMLRTEKNRDLIAEIDAGIKKETSVGCSVGSISCSVCGREIRSGECEHIKGRSYSGKKCYHLLSAPLDAYEWSFVAVPAQKNAGVTKSCSHGRYGTELEALADEYREELTSGILKSFPGVLPEMKAETMKDICASLTLRQLRDMRDAVAAQAKKHLPLVRQLNTGENNIENNNSEFLI